MKTVLSLLILFGGVSLLSSCRKSIDGSKYPFVQLHHCTETEINGTEVQLCFKDLIGDHRCPVKMACISEGYAEIKLTLSVKGQQAAFHLATSRFGSGIPTDTTVLGYKVKLLGLTPYPGDNSSAAYKAEVSISQ